MTSPHDTRGGDATTVIRGAALSFIDDPFRLPVEECTVYESDAIVVMSDGKITGFGPADVLLSQLPENARITSYGNCLILPGFIDCHVHYSQTEIIGAPARQLIDWLNDYAFVAERKFNDRDHAREVAKVFLRESLRCGTTTSAVYCTVDPISVDAFFEESAKLGMRNIAGKVLMDRNAPPELCDSARTGYDQSKALIGRWHGNGRALYGVTPRFAPTSTPEQMELAGALWKEHPGTYLQTHVAENLREVEWVGELYPERTGYVDVYRHYGQLGPRSILGHGIHLSEEEFQLLHDTGTAIAHCPTSNLFLGSGLFSIEKAMVETRPVRVGLATDLGGGTSFSPLVTMSEAYKIAQMNGYSLSPRQTYYLASLGAARALYLDDKIGSIAVGNEADLTVLDLAATPVLEYRLRSARDLDETLFVLMTLADDRAACATYVAGNLMYVRDAESREEHFSHSLEG